MVDHTVQAHLLFTFGIGLVFVVLLAQVEPGHWAIGRSLGEINLRAQTGASVLAIRRADRYTTSPTADVALAEGDTLYLLGDDSDIALALRHLAAG